MIVRTILLSFFLLFVNLAYSENKEYKFEKNKVRILSTEKKDNVLKFGLQFQLDKDWKIYWIYPGEAGSPPVLSFPDEDLIESIKVSWPMPEEEYDEEANLVSRIYKDEVIIPVQITVNNNKVEDEEIPVKLDFQICKDICIPLTTEFKLKYPIQDFYNPINAKLVKIFENKVPVNLLNQNKYELKKISVRNEKVTLEITANNIENKLNNYAYLIGDNIPNYRKHETIYFKNKISFILVTSQEKKFENSDVTIFFLINNESYFLKTKLSTQNISNIKLKNIFFIIFISFLGGLILNLMPCVLPILGLKITNFLKQIETRNSLDFKLSSIYISLGIITTFFCFALATIIFKTLGMTFGWGIQFQEPTFLYLLILVLIVFSLNLFGLINFKMPSFNLQSVTEKKNVKSNTFLSNFSTGIISTILATPCTAPFVGTAVTIAFSQGNYITIIIFLCMAIGKAFPYLLFIWKPNIIEYFPKPGKWMIYMKYFFGILFIVSIIWLVSLLKNHYSLKTLENKLEIDSWIEFDKEKIENYKLDGTPFIIDITADWCITCKINKKNVFDNKEIIAELDSKKLIKIRGDWTLPNDQILNFLISHGRYGIPFNIIFSKNHPDGVILNEILTKKHFLNVLRTIAP